MILKLGNSLDGTEAVKDSGIIFFRDSAPEGQAFTVFSMVAESAFSILIQGRSLGLNTFGKL